jgi:hypothetical protein
LLAFLIGMVGDLTRSLRKDDWYTVDLKEGYIEPLLPRLRSR